MKIEYSLHPFHITNQLEKCVTLAPFVFVSGTELHNAVIHGVEMVYEEQRKGTTPNNMVLMIILLTDGEPNQCMYTNTNNHSLFP